MVLTLFLPVSVHLTADMRHLMKPSCGGGREATEQLLQDMDVDMDVTQQTGALREFSGKGQSDTVSARGGHMESADSRVFSCF